MARSEGVWARLSSLAAALILVGACLAVARASVLSEAARRWVVEPVVFVTSPIGRAMRALWGAGSVWSENRHLKSEVARLRSLDVTSRDIATQNAQYRELLGFQARTPYRLVATHVIARSADRLGGTVVIDRGRDHGIAEGQTVLSLGGLAGRIVHVDPFQAVVRTLETEESPVSVYDERSRETGILEWRTGPGPHFALDDVPARADVQTGDLLLSTGYGGVFPRGLRVGRVTRAGVEARGLVKSADVEPATPFGRLTDLLVLVTTVPSSDSLTALWLDQYAVPLSVDWRRVGLTP